MSLNDMFDAQRDAQYNVGPSWSRGVIYHMTYWDEVRRLDDLRRNGSVQGGGLGGLILFGFGIWLLVTFAPVFAGLLFLAVVISLSSLVTGLLVLTATHIIAPKSRLTFGAARLLSRTALWQYVVITVVMSLGIFVYRVLDGDPQRIAELLPQWRRLAAATFDSFSIERHIALYRETALADWPRVAGSWLLVRGLGLLAFARLLARRVGHPYQGVAGWLVGVIVAFVAIELVLSVVVWGVLGLVAHSRMVPLSADERLAMMLVYLAVLVVPGAISGGLPGGILLRGLTAVSGGGRIGGFWRNYGSALFVLLVYGFTLIAVVACFRDADAAWWWVVRNSMEGPQEFASLVSDPARPLQTVLLFQLPGLLLGGGILVRRESSAFSGVVGYLRACGVALATCLVVWLPLWTIALRRLPQVVSWLNAPAAF